MLTFEILGAPRTLGNHPTTIRRGKATIRLPSPSYRAWRKAANAQLPIFVTLARAAGVTLPITDKIGIKATFFRDRATGDLDNYLKGLADYLQRGGIIANDRQIVHWDGSRLQKDADRPRVVVAITGAVC